MDRLKNQLLLEMQCPICFKYMAPPIRICSKGHNTCDKCIQKYSVCIKCRYPFMTTRNLALEALTFEIDIPCKKCDKKFTSDIFYSHFCDEENQNEENLYKCRIETIDKNYNKTVCRWKGYIMDIHDHFQVHHKTNYFVLDVGKRFKWKLPFQQNQENISVIVRSDEVFLQEVYYDFNMKMLYFAVYNLNLKIGEHFNYEITVGRDIKYEKKVYKNYVNMQKLMMVNGCININTDVFNMHKDREISWVLSINKV